MLYFEELRFLYRFSAQLSQVITYLSLESSSLSQVLAEHALLEKIMLCELLGVRYLKNADSRETRLARSQVSVWGKDQSFVVSRLLSREITCCHDSWAVFSLMGKVKFLFEIYFPSLNVFFVIKN